MAKSRTSTRKPGAFRSFRAAYRIVRNGWRPQSIDDLDRYMDAAQYFGGPQALAFSAYFSGVMQISQSIASIAFPLLKREGEMKRTPWREHPVYQLLNVRANPWCDSLKWRETAEMQCINFGNSYSQIVRDAYFRPREVYLLEPDRMQMDLKDSGEPVYIYRRKAGGERVFGYQEVFHLRGFGPDPYQGFSVIELHREALNLGLRQQEFSNAFIENGVHTSGVATHPNQMSEPAHKRLKDSLNDTAAGARNAGKILIFEEGMTFQTMSMPLKDAEFLGSKVFQLQEVARILNMPPHKLKDLSHATFSNIEHQQIEYVTDTIRPWAERWERAVDTQLLTPIEHEKGFAQHDLNQLMRGDMKTMAETQQIGRYAGLLSGDEGRFNLGMNPMENEKVGKRVWQPVNMIDAASDQASGIVPAPEGVEDAQ